MAEGTLVAKIPFPYRNGIDTCRYQHGILSGE